MSGAPISSSTSILLLFCAQVEPTNHYKLLFFSLQYLYSLLLGQSSTMMAPLKPLASVANTLKRKAHADCSDNDGTNKTIKGGSTSNNGTLVHTKISANQPPNYECGLWQGCGYGLTTENQR
jgi:hypothetical protein